jgi:hypothetical protein
MRCSSWKFKNQKRFLFIPKSTHFCQNILILSRDPAPLNKKIIFSISDREPLCAFHSRCRPVVWSVSAAAAHPQTPRKISRLYLFKFIIYTFLLTALLDDLKKRHLCRKDIKLKNYVNLERIKYTLGPVFIIFWAHLIANISYTYRYCISAKFVMMFPNCQFHQKI